MVVVSLYVQVHTVRTVSMYSVNLRNLLIIIRRGLFIMLWLVLVTLVTGVYVLLFFCRRKRADEGVAAGRTTSGVASTAGSRTGDNSHGGGSSGGTKQRRGDGLLHHRSDGIESVETMQLRKRLLLDSNCNCITISIDTVSGYDDDNDNDMVV